MDIRIVFSIISLILGFVAFIPYFRHILKGKTKPHVFSWIIWGLLLGTGFFAQVIEGGGYGAWTTLMASVLCFAIFLIAITKHKVDYITKLDWICFGGALLGIVLWILTSNPLLAVIIVTITDAVGFIPTYRKSYNKPHEETASLFALAFLSWLFSLFALQSLNLTTVLYPASLALTNGLFTLFLIVRRLTLK